MDAREPASQPQPSHARTPRRRRTTITGGPRVPPSDDLYNISSCKTPTRGLAPARPAVVYVRRSPRKADRRATCSYG